MLADVRLIGQSVRVQRDARPPFECPVCNYRGLNVKPYEVWPPPAGVDLAPPYEDLLGRASYEVCRRCGFEFGNDDNPGTAPPLSFEEYRAEWEALGSPWFMPPDDLKADRLRGRT